MTFKKPTDKIYGTDPDLDALVNGNSHDRTCAAAKGYALDILKHDEDPIVREAVAMACAYVNYNRHDIIIELSEDTDLGVLRCVAEASGRDGAVVQSVAENAIVAYNNSNKEYMDNKRINLVLTAVALNSDSESINSYVFEEICNNSDLFNACTNPDFYRPNDGPDEYRSALITLAKVSENIGLLSEIANLTTNYTTPYGRQKSMDNLWTIEAKSRIDYIHTRGLDVKNLYFSYDVLYSPDVDSAFPRPQLTFCGYLMDYQEKAALKLCDATDKVNKDIKPKIFFYATLPNIDSNIHEAQISATLVYALKDSKSSETADVPLTDKEKSAILQKMKDYCIKHEKHSFDEMMQISCDKASELQLDALVDIVIKRYTNNNITLDNKSIDNIRFALMGEYEKNGMNSAHKLALTAKLQSPSQLNKTAKIHDAKDL